jgi:hypothetical protein
MTGRREPDSILGGFEFRPCRANWFERLPTRFELNVLWPSIRPTKLRYVARLSVLTEDARQMRARPFTRLVCTAGPA